MQRKTIQPGAELEIADDESVAVLVLRADITDANLTSAGLLAALQEQKLAIEPDLGVTLERAIASMGSSTDPVRIVAARAVAAVDGEDGAIEWQPGFGPRDGATKSTEAGEMASEVAETAGKIDYHSQSHYVTAAEGDHLATIKPATLGVEGHDLFGKPIRARPGTACAMRTDQTVTTTPEGRLVAAIGGIVNIHNNAIKIVPVFDIPGSVDFKTGNVIFKGSVVVRGDVRDRFMVKAAEDVTIQGLIEGATIVCGRSFTAQCGMAAHDRGCLYVGGDTQAGYLKNVHGLVRGNLNVRRELIDCDLAIGMNLLCNAGAVIGGMLCIGGVADIGALGAATGRPTMLIFGTHPCQQQLDEALDHGAAGEKTAAAQAGSGSTASRSAKSGNSGGANQLADGMAEKVRACVMNNSEFTVGNARPVELTIQKTLHAGVIIRTGRMRAVIGKTLRGPLQIRGDQQNGLTYQMTDGVRHPLSDLAPPSQRAV